MTIKIFGDQGIGPPSGVKKTQKKPPAKEAGKPQTGDRVQFSSMLQEVSHAKGANSATNTDWSEKVRTLKEQIASGNYQPDLHKVAASLLRFLVEGK